MRKRAMNRMMACVFAAVMAITAFPAYVAQAAGSDAQVEDDAFAFEETVEMDEENIYPSVSNEISDDEIVLGTSSDEIADTFDALYGDDYPSKYKTATADSIVDEWNFYNRECTSFVAWRLNNVNKVGFSNSYRGVHWGNAGNWGTAARSVGITVDSNPVVGDVAWWAYSSSYPYGHVAWVAEVSGNNVTIEEYNYGNSHAYKTRTVSKSNSSGFIHIGGSVTVSNRLPLGYLDSISSSDGYINIGGWTFDPDSPANNLIVRVYADGYTNLVGQTYANKQRDDVNNAYGAGQYHGYSDKIKTSLTGQHTIYVCAADANSGENKLLINSPTTLTINQPANSTGRVIPDGQYHIATMVDRGHCMHARNAANTVASDPLVISSRKEDTNDLFTVTWLGNGYYKIIHTLSGYSIDVWQKSEIPEMLRYSAWNGGTNQQWAISRDSSGGYFIQSRSSGLYVDLYCWGINEDNMIIQNFGQFTANQQWIFIPWGASVGQTISNGQYYIESAAASGKALSPEAGTVTGGTSIKINTLPQSNQKFNVKYLGNGYYSIIQSESNLSLDVWGGGFATGTDVRLWTQNNEDTQKWIIKKVGTDTYQIISKYNGLFADVTGGSVSDNTNVQMWSSLDQNRQLWRFRSTSIPTITTSVLSNGTCDTAYSTTLTANGAATITWSKASGVLPTGLTLSSTGKITGTPTEAGTWTFIVTAKNSYGEVKKQFSITVYGAPPTISTNSLSDATSGSAYSASLAANGTKTITWSLASGSLPSGLTLSTSGTISGTPTSTGTYTFSVKAANSYGSATRQFSIKVASSGVAPVILTSSLSDATASSPYYGIIAASGTGPISYSVTSGALPSGLSLSSSGIISGTPTATGTYTFSIRALNSYGNNTVSYTLNVYSNGEAPSITTTSLADATLGAAYSAALYATGTDAISWTLSAGSLPDGLILSNDGAISGTPITTGSYTFSVKAANDYGNDSAQFTIQVFGDGEAPEITTDALPDASVGRDYTTVLFANGASPILWSVTGGSLPGGFTLEESTGIITGTPSATGSYIFTVQAKNDKGVDTAELSIVIRVPNENDDKDSDKTDGDADEEAVAVTGVTLNLSTLVLEVGDEAFLVASVAPSNATNKDVAWDSSDDAVVSVSDDGVIRGIANGTAIITATTDDGGFTASANITVTDFIDEDETENIYAVGQKINISGKFDGDGEKIVKYKSSNSKAVSVTNKGVITVKKAGTVSITAYVKQGKKYRAVDSCTIIAEKPKLNRIANLVRKGDTYNAADSITGTTLSPTRWASSKSSVLSVDEQGVLTAHKSGKAKITAYYGSSGTRGKVSVTVTVKIPKLNKASASVKVDKILKLKLSNTSGYSVTWTSSDNEIAIVSSNGRVIGISPGQATITASVNDVDYTCLVTVK